MKSIFCFLIFLLLFSLSSRISAQNLPFVNVNDIKTEKSAGMPIDEMISAVDGGGLGLSVDQNLDGLKSDDIDQAPETTISVEPSRQPDPVPVSFTPDSLKDLEAQGGLSTKAEIDAEVPTIFKLAVKFLERVVFRNDVEFVKRPAFDEGMDISGIPTFDKDTAGYAVIKKGSQSVKVDFDKKYDSPPVVTAALSLQQYDSPEVRAAAEDLLLISDVKYIITKVSKSGFEIMMDRKADSDIPFSWHALAVEKPKTFKKKEDFSKGGMDSVPDAESSRAGYLDSGASNFSPGQELQNSRTSVGNNNNN